MVERVAQPLQLATGNIGSLQGYSPQRAQVERAQVETSLATQALSGLLDIAGNVAEQKFQADVKYQYMQGQRARMLGKSFDEIETDPLSRPFVRGGFQDQDYRMQQADLSRQMQAFLRGKGRTLPPEQFLNELSKASQATLDTMGDGLSAEGRAQALASQTQLEEALMQAHSTAYRTYGIEQAGKRISAQGSTLLNTYGRAKLDGNGEAATAAAQQLAGFYQDIANSDTLPADMREKVSEQFVQTLLSEDHRELVQVMQDQGFFDTLGFDARTKINEWMQASEGRTKAKDAVTIMGGAAQFEKRVEMGQATSEEVLVHNAEMAQRGLATPAQQEALWAKFYTSSSNKETLTRVLGALNTGDVQAITREGWTPAQALDAWYEQADLQGAPLADKAAAALRMGAQIGVIPTRVASDVNAAVRSLSLNPEAANPEQIELLQGFASEAVRVSMQNPAAESTLLSALDRDVQPQFAQMIVDVQNGTDPMTSLRNAAAAQAAYSKLTPVQRTAMNTKLDTAIVEELSTGKFAQAWNLVTEGARKMNEGSSFETLKAQVHQEAVAIIRQPQFAGMSQEAVVKMAAARVQERTVEVSPEGSRTSRIVLPRNATLERLVGTPFAKDKTRVSAALAKLYPAEAKGFERDFYTSFDTVYTVQVDKGTGVPGVPEPVSWERVRGEIERNIKEVSDSNRRAYNGELIQSNGNDITVSGRNSAGIRKDAAYQFRKELLNLEGGVQLQAYKDRNGVAVGVGQNVTGTMKVGDSITAIEAEQMFLDSSDKAMREATRVSQQLGVTAVWGQLALAGAIYQLGPKGVQGFDKALAAIQTKDFETFQTEVRNSDWHKQTPNRAEWFITKMKGHFLGKQ